MKNGWYVIYTPILKSSSGFFEVNGANSIYKEKAIQKASRHVSVRDGEASIIRIDEFKEYIEWTTDNSFLKL